MKETLRPGEEIVWSGRPRTGLAAGDSETAALAAVGAFLLAGFVARRLGVDERLAFSLAALAGCVLGLSVSIVRATIAGMSLGVMLMSLAPVFAMACSRSLRGGGAGDAFKLLCPASSLGFLLVWVGLRYLENRATRYHLSRERGFVERPERYVVAFELPEAPVARPTPLARGLIGSIDLAPARGQIRTSDGFVMALPARRRRFVRVDEPREVVKAWKASRGEG